MAGNFYNQFGSAATYPQYQLPTLQQLQPQPIQGTQLKRVRGIDAVRQYPSAPNSTDAFFEEDEDIMYVKSTDVNNFPTIRKFRFEEIIDAPEQNTQQFVTNDKFDELINEFREFKQEVLNAQQSVRTEATPNNSKWDSNGKSKK